MGGYSFRGCVLAGLTLLLNTNLAVADTYQPSNSPQSYPTLAEAEAAMRAVSGGAALLQFNRITGAASTQIVRLYTVPTIPSTPYTFIVTNSGDHDVPDGQGSTRAESCNDLLTRKGEIFVQLATSQNIPAVYLEAKHFVDNGWGLNDTIDLCIAEIPSGWFGAPYYWFYDQYQATIPTCPTGYEVTFAGVDNINGTPYTANQIFVCTNPTTATITQTCTDGIPQIKPLGANPQKPSRWLPANPPARPNPIIEPSTQDYEVSVATRCGQVLPNANVTLNYSAVPYSGGHMHDDGRDKHVGLFELTATTRNSEPASTGTLQVNTGATGKVTVKYVAPQASGLTKVTLECTLPDGTPCESRDEHINVGINGLLRLGAGANYEFIGLTEIHPDTRFGTPSLVDAMRSLADSYVAQYPTTTRMVNDIPVTEPSKLFYNDMSLQWGGLLDCYTSPSCQALGGAPWKEPHDSHRLGKNADVDTTSIFNAVNGNEHLLELRRIIERELKMTIYNGNGHSTHWHLTKK